MPSLPSPFKSQLLVPFHPNAPRSQGGRTFAKLVWEVLRRVADLDDAPLLPIVVGIPFPFRARYAAGC